MYVDDVIGVIVQQYYQNKNSTRIMSKHKLPCTRCGTMVSPTWRPGPCGTSSLCNQCGVQYMRRQGRPRMIDLIMSENNPIWMERDPASLQWRETKAADIRDKRIYTWLQHEIERVDFVKNKKRKLVNC